jgi:hypothetical protein
MEQEDKRKIPSTEEMKLVSRHTSFVTGYVFKADTGYWMLDKTD